jgi:hypothetical protein
MGSLEDLFPEEIVNKLAVQGPCFSHVLIPVDREDQHFELVAEVVHPASVEICHDAQEAGVGTGESIRRRDPTSSSFSNRGSFVMVLLEKRSESFDIFQMTEKKYFRDGSFSVFCLRFAVGTNELHSWEERSCVASSCMACLENITTS